MRWLLALAGCLIATLASAQTSYFPAQGGTARNPPGVTPPAYVYNMALLATNAPGLNQSIWNSTISGACASSNQLGAVVYLPPGQIPITVPLAPITCLGLSIAGSGNQSTTLLLQGTGDAIWYQNPQGSTYGGYATVSNLRTYRADSPTSGAALKLDHATSVTVSNVRLTGSYYGVECISCLNIFFTNGSQADGLETQAGSALYRIHRGSSTDLNPSTLVLQGDIVNTSNPNSPWTYDHAVVINDVDGMFFGAGHYAWSRGSDVFIQPQYSSDHIDNILSDPTAYFDTSGKSCIEFQPYGGVTMNTVLPQNQNDTTLTFAAPAGVDVTGYNVLANGVTAGTTVSSGGATATVTLSAGVNSLGVAYGAQVTFYPAFTGVDVAHSFHGFCQGVTGDGLYLNDPALAGSRFEMYVLNSSLSAVHAFAGTELNFNGSIFHNPNVANGGSPTVIMEGNTSHVNLSGTTFAAGTHQPPEHILKQGQANYLIVAGTDFAGSTGSGDILDLSNSTTHTNIGACTTDNVNAPANQNRDCPNIAVSGNSSFAWNMNFLSANGTPIATYKGLNNSANPAYLTYQGGGSNVYQIFGSGATTQLDIRADVSTPGTVTVGSTDNDTVTLGSPGSLGLNALALPTDLNQAAGGTALLPFASITSIRAGQAVTGANVPSATTVSSVAGVAQQVQAASTGFPAGQFLVAFSNTTGLVAGKSCIDTTNSNTAIGTIVKTVASTSISLSAALANSSGSTDSITCSATQTAAAAFATGASVIPMASVGSYVVGDTCTDTTASLSLGTISKISTVGLQQWITLTTPATGPSSGATDSIKCSVTQTATASFPTNTTNTIIPLASTTGYVAGMQCHDVTGSAVIGDGNVIASVQTNASITMTSGVASNSSGAADSIKCDPVVTISNATTSADAAATSITFTNP